MPEIFDDRAWDEAGRIGELVRSRNSAERDRQRRSRIAAAVSAAAQQMVDARRDGMRTASFGSVSEFERDVIDVECFDELTEGHDFSSRLLGPWAQLRDELRARGITLSAMSRVAGTGCNARHWAFDLVARW